MTLSLETAWILTVLLVALRFGAVILLTPVFAAGGVPTNVRVLFVLALSAVVVAGLGTTLTVPMTVAALTKAAIGELIIGAVMAFGVFTAFGAFMLAGRIADMQLGFGVANLIDPATRTQAPLLGTFLNLLAVALFFAIDGHHLLLRGLAFSVQHIPPGVSWEHINTANVVAQFGAMFSYALVLVAPTMFVILLIDVVIAVIARTMPQVNVFIVSLPLKIFVGLAIFALTINFLSPVVGRIFGKLFEFWHGLFA